MISKAALSFLSLLVFSLKSTAQQPEPLAGTQTMSFLIKMPPYSDTLAKDGDMFDSRFLFYGNYRVELIVSTSTLGYTDSLGQEQNRITSKDTSYYFMNIKTGKGVTYNNFADTALITDRFNIKDKKYGMGHVLADTQAVQPFLHCILRDTITDGVAYRYFSGTHYMHDTLVQTIAYFKDQPHVPGMYRLNEILEDHYKSTLVRHDYFVKLVSMQGSLRLETEFGLKKEELEIIKAWIRKSQLD